MLLASCMSAARCASRVCCKAPSASAAATLPEQIPQTHSHLNCSMYCRPAACRPPVAPPKLAAGPIESPPWHSRRSNIPKTFTAEKASACWQPAAYQPPTAPLESAAGPPEPPWQRRLRNRRNKFSSTTHARTAVSMLAASCLSAARCASRARSRTSKASIAAALPGSILSTSPRSRCALCTVRMRPSSDTSDDHKAFMLRPACCCARSSEPPPGPAARSAPKN